MLKLDYIKSVVDYIHSFSKFH